MMKKIKDYMNKPLTHGWLWKYTIISVVISTLIGGVSLWKMGMLPIEQLFKPSSDWEDIPESKD